MEKEIAMGTKATKVKTASRPRSKGRGAKAAKAKPSSAKPSGNRQGGKERLRPGQLDGLVLAYMKKHVTLKLKGGKALETGAAIKAFSSSFSFSNGSLGPHSCAEAELAGAVGENPGALVNLSTTRIQGPGGTACTMSFFTVKYTIPTKGMTLEFTTNKAGEGLSKVSKFTLAASIYLSGSLVSTCEYSVELSGTYKFLTALQTKLTGTATLVKSTGSYCSSEALSAEFTVSSGGAALEAEG